MFRPPASTFFGFVAGVMLDYSSALNKFIIFVVYVRLTSIDLIKKCFQIYKTQEADDIPQKKWRSFPTPMTSPLW